MKIGVLALQGAFIEHIQILRQLNVSAFPIKLPGQLAGLDGLIIPGGESTSIGKLMRDYHLTDAIKAEARNGLAIWGTCAGMILLAKEISDADTSPLGLMDIRVKRNAFGRQVDSFETSLPIPILGNKPFPCVFIRAPFIEQVYGDAEALAHLSDGTIIAAREGRLLATAFHPELTDDFRFHQYFLNVAAGKEEINSRRGQFCRR